VKDTLTNFMILIILNEIGCYVSVPFSELLNQLCWLLYVHLLLMTQRMTNFCPFFCRSCSIYVNGKLLASSFERNRKVAGRIAAEKGLQKLRETCYTIKVYIYKYMSIW